MSLSPLPDTLIALRLSWPKPQAIQSLRDNHREKFTQACKLLKTRIDGCKCATLDDLNEDVAMSLANGFLAHVVKAKETDTLERFAALPAFSKLEWLCDLFWAASCIQQDAAANNELLRVIKCEVREELAHANYKDVIADQVIDDLPAHLHFTVQRGFNRGRPRLAHFSGK